MMRRVELKPTSAITALPQEIIPVFALQLPEAGGTVTVNHGQFIVAGTLDDGHGNQRLALTIGQRGCTCGCGASGRAMMYTPEVAHARQIAEDLVRLCDTLEAAAHEQAAAALAKASGK